MTSSLLSRRDLEEIYDKHTVWICLEHERTLLKEYADLPPKVAQAKSNETVLELMLRRYEEKKLDIDNDLREDLREARALARYPAPKNVFCTKCNLSMECEYKSFSIPDSEEEEAVPEFYMRCPNGCLPIALVYSDGTHIPSKHFTPEEIREIDARRTKNEQDFKENRERFCLSKEDAERYLALRVLFGSTDNEEGST